MAETKLHPGIPVTNEFDGCEPPEDTRAFGDVYADDSRMMMADSSRRTMFDGAETSSDAEGNLDYAGGINPPCGSPADDSRMMMADSSRRTMSDEAQTSSGAGTNNDYATGGSPGGSPAPKRGRPTKKQPPLPPDTPAWWNGRKIDTTLFCEEYLKTHDLRSINGAFFTPDGYCPADKLRYAVYDEIKQYVRSYAIQTAGSVVENLKAEAKTDEAMISEDILNLRDGTFDITKPDWTYEKRFCRNRLPVTLELDPKTPENWLRFVNELLEPRDIDTLQEYMGYCLVPTTKAQKMLLIIGNGGEGKSRIGVVMRYLLGDNMNYGSIPKLETNAFARADLEHKLLMVDDDMRMENLPTTSNLKALITSEGPMDLEKKGVQSYQGLMYCRLMAFSNGYLRSANDDSWGFFRRQLILTTKPRPEDRVDDPFLSDKLYEERDAVFRWALEGLYRLRRNNYKFTMSDKAKGNLQLAIDESNNVRSFLNSQGSFTFDKEGEITSRALYNIYRMWCEDNAETPLDQKRVIGYVRSHAHEYGLTYTTVQYQYKRVRGFRGIRAGLATPKDPVMPD